MKIESLLEVMGRIDDKLAMHHDRFPNEIDDLRSLAHDTAAKVRRFSFESQPLSIGIMGQVKAGKSTFLNALLFGGRPILPEAATPKTANLTRITYGITPTLVVHFYTLDEWSEISKQATSPGEHTEARAARDLLKMVQTNNIDPSEMLTRGDVRQDAADVDQLMGILNDYVGENGRFTALVKSTEIWLPLDELKGFELVDTPGMNDPVPSRTQKTREYMARCDVVFFLTRCAQFLDQSDMGLLASQLPAKGVKRIILIAGQYDGAILDDGYDRSSLIETERNIQTRLNRRAGNELGKLADVREKDGALDIAELLRAMKTPLFSSTYAFGFAEWPAFDWNSGMLHLYAQFTNMAENQWAGYKITKGDWERIGNFEALRTEYARARADKEAILEQQRHGIVPEAERALREKLTQLSVAVNNRREQLKNGTVSDIIAKKQASERRMQSMSMHLAEPINQAITDAQQKFQKLKSEMQSNLAAALKLETQTGTETETRVREVSDSKWYNPFSWGRTRTVVSTYTTSYEYIATSDAIEKIVYYKEENTAWISREFLMVVSAAKLKHHLKHAMLVDLETESDHFNPNEFRATLDGAINRIAIPELVLDVGDPAKDVQANFQGELRGDDEISRIRDAYRNSIKQVTELMLSEFERGTKTLANELEELKFALTHDLAKEIRKELDLLEQAFSDKNEELDQYENILRIVDECALSRTAE